MGIYFYFDASAGLNASATGSLRQTAMDKTIQHLDSEAEDGDFDNMVVMLAAQRHLPGFGSIGTKKHFNETRKPREKNKQSNFGISKQRFDRFYFADDKVISDADFDRRFRILRILFSRLKSELMGRDEFQMKRDATWKHEIHLRTKLIAALRVMAYGVAMDQVDELCELSESSTRKIFVSFLDQVISVYVEEYLRHPSESDLRSILSINSARGFPGCIGCRDCQHWEWKNCLVASAEQYKGNEKKPTVVLEEICDGELWIWGHNFWQPLVNE